MTKNPVHFPMIALPESIPLAGVSGRFDWPAGKGPTFLLHGDFDLLWVLRGALGVEMQGRPKFIVGRDEFFLLPPLVSVNVSQGLADAARGEGLVFRYCHFDFRAAGAADGKFPEHPPRPMHVPLKFDSHEAPHVLRAYRALAELAEGTGSPLSSWHREAAIIELAAALGEFALHRRRRPGEEILKTTSPDDARVSRLCSRIMADPGRAWRVTELADSVGLSASRLHAVFRASVGVSLKTYIVRTRMQHALRLLRNRGHLEQSGNSAPPPSIKEVAAACGFSSQHFFSRQFKKLFRQTPVEFRDAGRL